MLRAGLSCACLTLPCLQTDRSSYSACCSLLIVRETIAFAVFAVPVVVTCVRELQMRTDE